MKVILKFNHKDLGSEHGISSLKLEVLIGAKHILTKDEWFAIIAQAVEDIKADDFSFSPPQ